MARIAVKSDIAGKVWQIETNIGDELAEDDPVMVLESMKMEIPVPAPRDDKLVELCVAEGDPVNEDDIVAYIEA